MGDVGVLYDLSLRQANNRDHEDGVLLTRHTQVQDAGQAERQSGQRFSG